MFSSWTLARVYTSAPTASADAHVPTASGARAAFPSHSQTFTRLAHSAAQTPHASEAALDQLTTLQAT
eukprot:902657-Pyramimonas_sp.AAC.1